MRIPGWERLLYEHIRDAHNSEFCWGENDCALWCSDWVHKANGMDLGSAWRGQYTSEEGLQALMQERGFALPADIANEHSRQVSVTFAARGDIVLHPQGCLGICDGISSYFLTLQGLTRLNTHRCVAAWKVE
jgi:hypothetical protein